MHDACMHEPLQPQPPCLPLNKRDTLRSLISICCCPATLCGNMGCRADEWAYSWYVQHFSNGPISHQPQQSNAVKLHTSYLKECADSVHGASTCHLQVLQPFNQSCPCATNKLQCRSGVLLARARLQASYDQDPWACAARIASHSALTITPPCMPPPPCTVLCTASCCRPDELGPDTDGGADAQWDS
jgi:hypothetical protein